MGGENRNHSYFPQHVQRLLSVDPGSAHAFEGAAERAFQSGLLGMQFGRASSSFAMVGLSQIGKFEINRERLGDPVGLVDAQAGDDFPRLMEQRVLKIRH